MKKEELILEIEGKITEVEKRIDAGKDLLIQCRKQMVVLKRKLKEFRHIENTVRVSSSAIDGDL